MTVHMLFVADSAIISKKKSFSIIFSYAFK